MSSASPARPLSPTADQRPEVLAVGTPLLCHCYSAARQRQENFPPLPLASSFRRCGLDALTGGDKPASLSFTTGPLQSVTSEPWAWLVLKYTQRVQVALVVVVAVVVVIAVCCCCLVFLVRFIVSFVLVCLLNI